MKQGIQMIDSYRKLPIGRYIQICKAMQEELTEIDRQVRVLSLLTGMTEDELLALPLMEYRELASRSRFLDEECRGANGEIGKEFKVGGFTLVPVTDHRKICTAQYIDFQEYAKQGDDGLVEVLSTLLVPKGKDYNKGYDIVEVQGAIRDNMPVFEVVSLTAFFLRSFGGLIKDSLTYSRKEAERLAETERRQMMLQRIQEAEAILQAVGVG